jgi:hypothetical protein
MGCMPDRQSGDQFIPEKVVSKFIDHHQGQVAQLQVFPKEAPYSGLLHIPRKTKL